ncbi:DUF6368 family protein [Streptomyces sp. NPDC059009]|uniref:DUF6368 family protein n=1 Tax=Streptomyces sp. NPDC059009 TaxID=3346694 RepID=UPI0036C00CDE
MLVIELARAIPAAGLRQLRLFLAGVAESVEERRVGEFDLQVRVESLGVAGAGRGEGTRPMLVSVSGPGFGDEEVFDAEHADEVDQERFVGFTPTHAVDVIAFCGARFDHVVVALLTAGIMDAVGGVANAELHEDQLPLVAGLPGLLARRREPWEAAYGTGEFLRAWAATPGFRLVK